MNKHRKTLSAAIEKAADDRTYAVTLYDASVPDRDQETIDMTSWRPFPKRLPLQIDHDHSVLKSVGYVDGIHVQGERLRGRMVFAPEGVSGIADQVQRQVSAGMNTTVSIGFLAHDVTRLQDGIRKWADVELLELSLVQVPSSPGARIDAKALRSFLGTERFDNQPDADRLDSLVTELKAWRRKSGRVLSAANEQSIRDAIASLEAVLAHLDADDDKGFLTFDDLGGEIPDELVAETFAKMLPEVLRSEITSAINRMTGRLD